MIGYLITDVESASDEYNERMQGGAQHHQGIIRRVRDGHHVPSVLDKQRKGFG